MCVGGILLVLAVSFPLAFLLTVVFVRSFKRSYLRGCYKPPTNKELTRMAVGELWGERVAAVLYGKEKKE